MERTLQHGLSELFILEVVRFNNVRIVSYLYAVLENMAQMSFLSVFLVLVVISYIEYLWLTI